MEHVELDTTPTTHEPAPLRVVKRQSQQIRGSDNTSEYGSTRSRRTSGQTNESIGSAPGHPSWDRPLTVKKKRQSIFSPSYSPSPAVRALRPERSYMMFPRANERITSRVQSSGGTSSLNYPSPIREMPDRFLPEGMDGFLSPSQYSSYDGSGSVPQSPFPMDYGFAYQAHISQNAFVLVPHVSVTPEPWALGDGNGTLWAAIEVTGQVCQSSNSQPAFSHHVGGYAVSGPDPFRYGLLFDMTIDIQPLSGGAIVELLQDDPIPTQVAYLTSAHDRWTDKLPCRTLYAGSTILILAHIRVKSKTTSAASSISVPRQQSDELMEDLEYHLGSPLTDHITIRLKYAHTAFPQHSHAGAAFDSTGITSFQTRLDTLVTASLKRDDPRSPWSSQPILSPNPIFDIITAHWPPDRAANAINRMLTRYPAVRHLDVHRQLNTRLDRVSDRSHRPSPVDSLRDGRKTAPPGRLRIPRRETSLTKNATVRRPEEARTSWADLRRTSAEGGAGRTELSRAEQNSSKDGAGASELTLRSRTSAAASTTAVSSLDGVVTPASTVGMRIENSSCRESVKGVKGRKGGQAVSRPDSGRERSDGGRWNWANWW